MSKQKSAPRIPLFSERREPPNRDKYIYGSEKYEDKVKDTFPKAFSRYMSDSGPDGKKVSARKLHTLSGVSKSAINYYLLGSRRVTYETLCAVCIALLQVTVKVRRDRKICMSEPFLNGLHRNIIGKQKTRT